MNYSDYEKLILELGSDKQDKVLDILNKIREDSETFNSLTEKITQQENKIADLRDSNTKLFLRVSGAADATTGGDETVSINDVIKDWGK